VAGTLCVSTPSIAGDMSLKDDYAAPHSIWRPGWIIRARGIGVIPDEDSSDWGVGGSPDTTTDLSIDNAVVPELDISYFFTKNIAMELVLAVRPHTIDAE